MDYLNQKPKDSEELKELRKELELLKNQLTKRNLELRFHHQISNWANDEKISIDEFIQNITDLIPQIFSLSENISAKISFQQKTYQSNKIIESPHYHHEIILNEGTETGKIEVYDHGFNQNRSFFISKEEKQFLQNLLQRIVLFFKARSKYASLNVRKSHYESIFNHSPDGFLILDKGIFIDANPIAAKMLGYDQDELIGKKPHEISPEYQPNGEKSKEYAEVLIAQTLRNKKKAFEWQHQRKDGSLLWVQVHLSTWQFQDKEVLITSWRDITEKKKAEEELLKYKTIADKSNYGIAINSLDGTFLYVNQAWADMHHYSPDELLGQHISICHTQEQMKIVGREIEKLIKSGSMAPMELYHLTKNKQSFPTLTGATMIKDTDGHPLFLSANCIDISELKNTHQLLVSQNNKLRNLVNAVPDTILHIKKDGTYIDFIRPVDQLSSPLKKGPHISELICKRNLSLYEKMIRKCKLENQLVIFEHDHIGEKEMEYREARLIPLGNEEVLAIIRNTSEQVRSDLTIKKLSLAIEQSPVMVVITDTNGNIEYTNDAFTKITGYEKDLVKGQNTRLLKSGKNDPEIYKELWDTITKGKSWKAEWINKKKDQSLYWEQITINPLLNEKKEIINYLAIKQDISERKEKELQIKELTTNLEFKINERTEALQLSNEKLLEEVKERKKSETKFATTFKMGSAMMTLNYADTGEFIDVNDIYTEVLGYTREDLLGGYLSQRLMEENDPAINEVFQLLAEGKSVSKREINIPTKSGEYKTVLYSSDLIYLDDRPVNLSVAVDISELKESEAELIKARKEAEKANKTKSEFLANMSHEIRTPMNAVLGYTDLLIKQVKDSTQKNYLENIQISGQSLLRIINDILDLSKIEAGKMDLQYHFVNIHQFFNHFKKMFQLKADGKGIELILQLDPQLPEFIHIDETRMRQILINIIGNAVKFTREGFVMIEVKASQLMKGQDTERMNLEVLIKDSGPGIPLEMQSEIFNEFVQVTDENNIGGTGLGLPISKKLIQMMNGKIDLVSKPGTGSTFRILIPDLVINPQQETSLHSPFNEQKWKFKASNILVVDDIQLNIDFIKDVLSDHHLNIIQAKNGLEALEKMEENEIHLVITDIRMPHMSGYELLEKIRNSEKHENIPVIAYSASLVKKDEDDLKQKFSAFLSKPLEMDVLFETLDQFLVSHSENSSQPGKNNDTPAHLDIHDIEGLIDQLQNKLNDQYQCLQQRQPIEQVKDFSQQLIQAGQKHKYPVFEKLGQELASAVKQFDIKRMISKIEEFNTIKHKLLKQIQHG